MSARNLTEKIVNAHADTALQKLRNMFRSFAGGGDSGLKKADTLAFWLETFSDYLQRKKDFNYSSLPQYKRGSIISVNFGFNVGSEYGGLHYAVVISKHTEHISPVLTVIPLTSGTQEDTYKRDVYLGSELYDKLTKRYSDEESILLENLKNYNTALSVFSKITGDESNLPEELRQVAEEYLRTVKAEADKANERLRVLRSVEKRTIDRLKGGSIALMGQITTVSKIRIYKPKSKNDLMHNLKLSDGAMDKINLMLRELYIYEK